MYEQREQDEIRRRAGKGPPFVRYVEPGCPYRADDVMAPEQAVSTGTTIMAVEFDGGVVLGADSRTSTGDYVANRASRKISKVHDKIFVCRSGSAADTQALTGFVQNYLSMHAVELGALPSVNTCANLFKVFAYNNKDRLTAGLIVAGWDEKKGGQVYSIPLGGTRLRQPCVTGGSGSMYISALVDSEYRPGMTKQECLQFVRLCIAHAMALDGSSGGLIRTVAVDATSITEETIEGNKLPYGP
uniref:Proteasome subunit beta n=1 Tax=Alexandrium catenella TaxID=2925 RepID=A0A7S1QL07_ALECA